MKRFLQWAGLVLLVLAVAVGSVWYSAFSHNSPIVDASRVADGVETVKTAS